MTAAEIVKALGSRGDSAPCPVPGHGRGRGDRNHSLSVHDGADGKLLVHCHGGCPQADVWAALQNRGLVANAKHVSVLPTSGRSVQAGENCSHIASSADRRAEALAIWEASVPAFNTPAQDYLACRGIVIQPPACIRYHPGINALVALVQAKDGTFSGIQRIYLATDRRGTWKQGRYSLGPIKGGAVRLTPIAESIQITESVEDGLALLQMTDRPTWAVPGAGFMQDFEPPPEVEKRRRTQEEILRDAFFDARLPMLEGAAGVDAELPVPELNAEDARTAIRQISKVEICIQQLRREIEKQHPKPGNEVESLAAKEIASGDEDNDPPATPASFRRDKSA